MASPVHAEDSVSANLPSPDLCWQLTASIVSGGNWGNRFVPASDVSRLITPDHVVTAMPDAPPDLVDFVCARAAKVFAITLLCGMTGESLFSAITCFKEHEFVDTQLPILQWWRDHTEASFRANLELDAFQHPLWTNSRFQMFYTKQWLFQAPIFTPEQFLYELHPDGPLPFTEIVEMRYGRSGIDYKVEIHPAHQQILPNVSTAHKAPSSASWLMRGA